jgi:pimeloyl-ACP methyl ester carboxylesterase
MRRAIRLAGFALTIFIIMLLVVDIILGWSYALFFTAPSCQETPSPPSDLPAPQEIILQTEDGLSLRAWYFPGSNGVAIIAAGGLTGSLGQPLPPVGFLARQGYGVLQIDSRACAQPAKPTTLGANEVLDMAAGLAYLQQQPGIERIGMIGFSMGGVTAIRTAARYPQIEAVVAEGGYFNLGDDIIEPGLAKSPLHSLFLYTVAGAFWLQSGVNPWIISPIADLPKISPRPVLLIYGEKEVASGRAREQFLAAGEPKQLWIVPGSLHGSNYQIARNEYEQRVLALFDQALRPTLIR